MKKDVTHLVQLVDVLFVTIILRYSDPLSQNLANNDYVQHLAPTKLWWWGGVQKNSRASDFLRFADPVVDRVHCVAGFGDCPLDKDRAISGHPTHLQPT